MTEGVTITCEGANGATLEVVQDIIAQRSKVLMEYTRDAVVATAINILSSLRASTLDAKKRKRFNFMIKECPEILPSFSNSERRRVLRTGDRLRGPKWNPEAPIRWSRDNARLQQLKVFRVVPEAARDSVYLYVGTSMKDAQTYERNRIARRIERYGTLGKRALGIAMSQISMRSVRDNTSPEAERVASRLSHCTVTEQRLGFGAGEFGVEVLDALDYSVLALKGGQADIDTAFQRAANKTAGIMKQHLAAHGQALSDTLLGRSVEVATPFPDIRRT